MSDWWQADPVFSPRSNAGNAISKIESGGRYDILGPTTRTGDRAHGKYQVMGANIGPWTQEVFGQPMTPQQFLANPEAQEAVFNAKFGEYEKKYGPSGAARAWFAGEKGMHNPNARDILGTSVRDYENKFNSALGFAGQETKQPPAAFQNMPQAPQPNQNWWANDPVADQQQPAPSGPTFDQRFPAAQPQENPALKRGLEQTALDMTRGPAQSPVQRLATDFMNIGPAASQGTTPMAEAHQKNLISTEVHQNDAGEILFRDTNGKLVPTDANKHVALRDPADGIVKVYARTEKTDEGPVSSASRILSAGMAAGAPTARAAIPTATKAIVPAASDIFATSKAPYRAFKNEAGKVAVTADDAAGMAERIRGALTNSNLIPELAQPVYSAVGILEKGGNITLDALQNVKRVVGRSFNSPDKNVRDAAAVASGEIGKIIAEVSPSAAQNLKTADAIHSTARSVQDLQRKADVADLRAGRAGYKGNAVNSMRQVLSPIVQRATEGKNTGFKPNEIEAMRQIVEGTGLTNALRGVGQLSPSKGIIQTVGAGGAAAVVGPAALAIPAIGAASNKLATILTGKQIDHLKELVAKRSPAYAEAVAKATEKYERAQMELVNNPGPNRLAAYLNASRALSAGLSRDGIAVTSGDLLKAIQGPVKSAAEDE